ncbi:MGH1-like glycoside hydrolase domain-containing protein [Microlunatus soli]|uniref:Mannosylglycerate hydrolase MGH1-like glycoside hydrolase domain-containing protein n=1 Tax=Microlunatus soli TaxID=630515 RepID=A0A1H1TVJ4_9ACTN|nr:hypothetical protein [Microlunatus soli]SDS63639.1 hypothetical protein SAMN04489812_2520 [Microlunatus soli]
MHDRCLPDPSGPALQARARHVLQQHWSDDRGYCLPHPGVYPHLWLWDSCFHAIIWAALNDRRAGSELDAVLAGQLPGGMVPHMRYAGASDTWLGPLQATSSITQPPMFGHAARVLTDHGMRPGDGTLARAKRGLDWLWEQRRTDRGLIYVVHPWEAGNDHGQRWDDWGAPGRSPADYSRPARTAWNKDRMRDVEFADDGSARWSSTFVVCPAAFNAYVADNMIELAALLDDQELAGRGRAIAAAMDNELWNPGEGLWSDLPVVGGGSSARLPVSDGVMGALVTADQEKATTALRQLDDPNRFGAQFGPANMVRTHPSYDPQTYWRGPTWPPLNYLFWRAQRRWGLTAAATDNARRTAAGAQRAGWAEYWNPEDGTGLGAAPQSWTGLAALMARPDTRP